MELSTKQREELLKSQQAELDGMKTYLKLTATIRNKKDAETFRQLAADEGRHAAVFRKYTGEILTPKNIQANAVVVFYHLLGKKLLYPLISRFEYAAIPKYERMEKAFPEVETVKNDEKRHGDKVKALLDNGEDRDKPWLPVLVVGAGLLLILAGTRWMKKGSGLRRACKSKKFVYN